MKPNADSSVKPWTPREGWGTFRHRHVEDCGDGKFNVSFRFVPDDGGDTLSIRWENAALKIPQDQLGEYARGVAQGDNFTVKVTPAQMTEVEDQVFARINGLDRSKRKTMYESMIQSGNDMDADAGWAWTAEYRLVKKAPGLFKLSG